MIILGIDVESTGLEEDDQIVEMGGVLFDTETKNVLASFGKIYKTTKWGEEAAECHGISRELSNMMPHIDDEGTDPWDALSGHMAKYAVAHNAACDHPFVTTRWPKFKTIPWLCTQRDVLHEQAIKKVSSRRLGHLAVDYKLPITDWHRALADAIICAKIAAFHDLDEAYERKLTPKFRLLGNGGRIADQKELLGEAPSVTDGVGGKYRWNPDKKCWWKENLSSKYVELDVAYIKKVLRSARPKWAFELEKMDPPSY